METRTPDLLITNQLLYRLSYAGAKYEEKYQRACEVSINQAALPHHCAATSCSRNWSFPSP